MEQQSNKLVILDLDETLIHASTHELDTPCHFKAGDYFIYERPFLQTFLTGLAEHFTIGIWSSAGDDYVAEIVQQIKPASVEFLIAWGRSKCSMKRNVYLDTYAYEKRLTKLKSKGFTLEQILIVDDSPSKTQANYGNAIYIQEYKGDSNDQELQFLHNYLLTLKTAPNVRTIEKRGWRRLY